MASNRAWWGPGRGGYTTATKGISRWDQIDFAHAVLHVRRAKKGTPATHPIVGDEMRALRKLQREQDPKSPFVFTSERGSPFTTAGFARMVERAGVEAKLGFPAHPHMLRHACGFALANKGHDTRALQAYLGHRNIQHTVRYTELSPGRFKDFWRYDERPGHATQTPPDDRCNPAQQPAARPTREVTMKRLDHREPEARRRVNTT